MRKMPDDLRLVDGMLFGCLRVVAAAVSLAFHFDLVTRIQGMCLGITFITLLAASIMCSLYTERRDARHHEQTCQRIAPTPPATPRRG